MVRSTISRPAAPFAVVAAWVLLAAGSVAAQEAPEKTAVLTPDDAEWTEIVPGIEFGALFGDWGAEEHGKLVRLDPGVMSPMHRHSGGFRAVVISGNVMNPHAGEEDPPRMGPGTYWATPAGAVHATGCVSEDPCLIYAHQDALWDYEPAED